MDAIERFVEQALYVSRSDSVEKDYLLRKVQLDETVFAAVRRYAKLCSARRSTVQTEHLDGTVYTDGKWLEFILGQILINAIQYAPPEHGCIRIRARWHTDCATLSIADNGTGIQAQDLPRLFEKGFTGQNGRRQNKKATGIDVYKRQQSLFPVTQKISDSHSYLKNNAINTYHTLIQQMAQEKGIQYLNVRQAVENSHGVLPEEASTDGVHLNKTYCIKWLDYIRTHSK